LLCIVVTAAAVRAGVPAGADAADWLAGALEANERLAELAGELRAENARLRERDAAREAELERLGAELAVLQRMLFGRSSERAGADCADSGRLGGGGAERPPRQRGRAGNLTNGFPSLLHSW
jgi:transposase